ncbi:MAG: hypothetical protein LBL69_00970 [Zoogloeaceae bacterium]|nr:hypothetical protein [Zoogloeaceae bacterium]
MKFDQQKVWQVIRLFFPEQRKWAAKLLLLSGSAIVTGPKWVPYVDAFFVRNFDINVLSPDPTIEVALLVIGVFFSVLGVLGVIANVVLDLWLKRSSVSVEDDADKKTLQELFSELHLPTLDIFIYYGKLSMVYTPVLYYFSGLEAIVQAAKYHIHDRKLKEGVECLYVSLSKALSYGEYFTDMPNKNLQKFDSRRDIHVDPRAREAQDAFIRAVYDTETHLKELCRMVRSKYTDFDLDATSRQALDNYRSNSKKAAAALAEVLDKQA